MNLNISVQDLRLGRYEAQKAFLFQRFVTKRAILNDPDEGEMPPQFLRSELLDLMLASCRRTGVVVVRADRGLGKSTAAKFLLKNSAGGIMFCNCKSTTSSGRYWKGVASALGLPREVYENDSTWELLLVKAVAAAKRPEEVQPNTASWAVNLLESLLSLCGGGEAVSDGSSDDPPTIDGLSLAPLTNQPRALLVFDDFNNAHDDDILFMEHLYPIVKSRGVLAFVMVRDEVTANRLLELNGWGRISPLEGICENVGPKEAEKVPRWRVPIWTRPQLEALVRSQLGEVDLAFLDEERSGNPLDVLDLANALS